MPTLPPGAETELGAPGLTGGSFRETWEETAELLFPNNLIVFDRMRRTDGQIRKLLRAINLPIMGARWHLDGEDVRPEVKAFVEDELGLNAVNRGRSRRARQGVNFPDFLRHALLSLPCGFMVFEQVYEIGDPPPGLEQALPFKVAHLRKLAPRMPRTITDFVVARDGGLEGVKQFVPVGDAIKEITLPVERLVVFVHEREGADWAGNSLLRSSYKNWLIKDGLLRLGPMSVERNGMGLPFVGYPDGGDREIALTAAKSARAGEDAGVALPLGYTFELKGVTGSTKDELPLVKFHNEEIGGNALAMFMDLGHDAGARSLGETFLDFFLMAENGLVDEISEVITEYVIRDLVAINFGEDEPYPSIGTDKIVRTSAATPEALKILVEGGLLTVTNEDEAEVRRRYDLPSAPGPLDPDQVPDEDVDVIEDVLPDDPQDVPTAPGDPFSGRRRRGLGKVPTAASLTPERRREFEAESATIRANAKKRENRRPHRFTAAEWTHPNGHPRCIRCGDEEPIGGTCSGKAAATHAGAAPVGPTIEALEARLAAAKARRATLAG